LTEKWEGSRTILEKEIVVQTAEETQTHLEKCPLRFFGFDNLI